MNRFMDSSARALQERPNWHKFLMQNEFIAIEENMMTSGKVDKMVIKMQAKAMSELEAPTDPLHPKLDEKVLQKSNENAIIIGISMMSDPGNKEIVDAICVASEELVRWQKEQNHANRSAQESQAWLTNQVIVTTPPFCQHRYR